MSKKVTITKQNVFCLLGLLFLLLGIILQQSKAINDFIKKNEVSFFYSSIVPFLFEFVKCLGVSFFISSIIPEEKNYSKLNRNEKKALLLKLLNPKEDIQSTYTNISAYIDEFIDSTVDILNDNFRVNYTLDANAKIEDGKIVVESEASYREYKLYGSFQRLYSGYESKDSQGNSFEILCNNKKIEPKKVNEYLKGQSLPETCTLSFEDSLEKIDEFVYSKTIDKEKYIDVKRKYKEFGNASSMLFSLRLVKPCEGITIKLHYKEDLFISDELPFGDFNTFNISDDKTNHVLTLQTSHWMKPGLGIAILIEKVQG